MMKCNGTKHLICYIAAPNWDNQSILCVIFYEYDTLYFLSSHVLLYIIIRYEAIRRRLVFISINALRQPGRQISHLYDIEL